MSKESNCLLDRDLNNCPLFCSDTDLCRENNMLCGMYNKNYMKKEKKYRRERRWYEKYYKQGDFIA